MDWTWLITAATTVGVILNARQRIECFYIWLVTNAAWFVVDMKAGLYGQAAMFALYFFITIYAIVTWKRKAKEAANGQLAS